MSIKDLYANLKKRVFNFFATDPPVSLEEMRYFEQEYYAWWNFIAGNFPCTEFDMNSDEEVIECSVWGEGPEMTLETEKFLEEGVRLIADPNFPWRAIGQDCNYFFADADAVREWITHLMDLIRQKMERAAA